MHRRVQQGWAFLSGLVMAMGTMFHITLLGYIVSLGLGAIVIDRLRGRMPVMGALLYSLGFATGLVPFATWILTAAQGREGFRAEFLSRAVQTSMVLRLIQEQAPVLGPAGTEDVAWAWA